MKQRNVISKPHSDTQRSLKFNFFKDMIDKEKIEILNTPEGKIFVKAKQCIHGSYSTTRPYAIKTSNFNNNSSHYHQVFNSTYVDPTLSMYAIIEKKHIFLEALLKVQIEQEYQSDHTNFLKNILYQGILNKKTDILNLAIELHSNKCFDVILTFIQKTNLNGQKINIDYGIPTALYLAILHNNDHAIKSLLEMNPSPDPYISKDKYISPFILSIIKGHEVANKLTLNFFNEYQFIEPQKFESLMEDKSNKKIINEYVESNKLNSSIKNKKDSEENSIPISILIPEIPQDTPTDNDSTYSKCSFPNCKIEGSILCQSCNNYFCEEHIISHDCKS